MCKSRAKTISKYSKRLKGQESEQASFESSSSSEVVTPLQTFYVCFSNAGKYFGSRYLKADFTHMSIMQRIPSGFIAIDPTWAALDIYLLPAESTRRYMKNFLIMRPDYTILEIIKEVSNKEHNMIRLGLQSCVTVCAYAMGIHVPWWVITPYQFYKQLKVGAYGIRSLRRM